MGILADKVIEVILDSDTTKEQLEFFEERLQKNVVLSDSKSMKSIYSCFIAFFAWLIIKTAMINKLSFFGIEFIDLSMPLIVLPPIVASFYYRFICETIFSQEINVVLRKYYSQKLQTFEKRNLTEFLAPPTMLNIENAFANIEDDKNSLLFKLTDAWLSILSIIVLFIPIVLLLWMVYSLLASPVVSIFWSSISSILVLVLITRSLCLFFIFRESA